MKLESGVGKEDSNSSPELKYDLSFEKEQKNGVTHYFFKNVIVSIDITGKNYKDLPEILFGTFEGETIKGNALEKPKTRRVGVDMDYIAECVKTAAQDSGINEFWFYPFGEDISDDQTKRKEARLRLFSRYGKITPAPGGYGYILRT